MKFGVTVRPTQSIVGAAETARRIEDAGYHGAWIADHYFHRDASAALALMLSATSTLTVGTAVMSPLLRHPALLASMAATLREVGPDRFVLGLGVGGYEFASELNLPTPRPLGLVQEATDIIRGLTAGRCEVAGKYFSATGSSLRWAATDGPLYLAGRGPKMLQLAGQIADGVITHGVSEQHLVFVSEQVAAGAARRSPDGPRSTSVCLMLDVEVDDDADEAWKRLQPRCLTMAAGSFADELIEIYGLDQADVAAARAALRSGDRVAAASLVTRSMAAAFGMAGSAGDIADRILALADYGVDEVIITVGGVNADHANQQLAALAKELPA